LWFCDLFILLVGGLFQPLILTPWSLFLGILLYLWIFVTASNFCWPRNFDLGGVGLVYLCVQKDFLEFLFILYGVMCVNTSVRWWYRDQLIPMCLWQS
jgi:hypothetical protein